MSIFPTQMIAKYMLMVQSRSWISKRPFALSLMGNISISIFLEKRMFFHLIHPPYPSITCSITTRKRTSLASDKLACMVVLNNLVSGNTVYYKTQLLSYKLTESKILVSIAILIVLILFLTTRQKPISIRLSNKLSIDRMS